MSAAPRHARKAAQASSTQAKVLSLAAQPPHDPPCPLCRLAAGGNSNNSNSHTLTHTHTPSQQAMDTGGQQPRSGPTGQNTPAPARNEQAGAAARGLLLLLLPAPRFHHTTRPVIVYGAAAPPQCGNFGGKKPQTLNVWWEKPAANSLLVGRSCSPGAPHKKGMRGHICVDVQHHGAACMAGGCTRPPTRTGGSGAVRKVPAKPSRHTPCAARRCTWHAMYATPHTLGCRHAGAHLVGGNAAAGHTHG